jgi:hypothetical protein
MKHPSGLSEPWIAETRDAAEARKQRGRETLAALTRPIPSRPESRTPAEIAASAWPQASPELEAVLHKLTAGRLKERLSPLAATEMLRAAVARWRR